MTEQELIQIKKELNKPAPLEELKKPGWEVEEERGGE